MKLQVQRDALLAQLQLASRIVATRSAIQALSGIQFEANSDGCRLRATDMEVGLDVPLEAEVKEVGTVILPARLFLDVVNALPSTMILMEETDNGVKLKCGRAKFNIRTLRGEDFPTLPSLSVHAFSIPATQFVETALKVADCASRDDTRPVLTGVSVSVADRKLTMVATDSYRLAVKETTLDADVPPFQANVPARALKELARLARAGGEMSVSATENQVVFETDAGFLSSRLISGAFPDHDALIPREHEIVLAIPNELATVSKRVGLLAQNRANLVVRLSPTEITVSTRTPDVGEATESVIIHDAEATLFEGDPVAVGFSPEYLTAALESMSGSVATLRGNGPLRPWLLEANGDGFRHLVMPMRISR